MIPISSCELGEQHRPVDLAHRGLTHQGKLTVFEVDADSHRDRGLASSLERARTNEVKPSETLTDAACKLHPFGGEVAPLVVVPRRVTPQLKHVSRALRIHSRRGPIGQAVIVNEQQARLGPIIRAQIGANHPVGTTLFVPVCRQHISVLR